MAVSTPFEFPGQMRAYRIMREQGEPPVEGWAGTILEIDCYHFDTKVLIRFESSHMGHGGKLKIFIKDEDGVQKVVEYRKVEDSEGA
jgi:hypothetical protein